MFLQDSYGRQIRDLRISVTDRCNFRCFYCLPNNEPTLARKEKLLSYEEIAAAAEIFVSLGIEKIRLTGGEPLLRKNLEKLVSKLSELKPRLKDIALTTNGFLFPERAELLKNAGLDRVTISLDSLKRENFAKMTGIDALNETLTAIEAAKKVGLDPIKVNSVIVRGHNENELVDFADFARKTGVSFRFIEFMPLDAGHDWDKRKVVSGKEIFSAINNRFPLKLKQSSRGSETAWKYDFADGAPGEIGIIAPVTEIFCGQCSRIRLTADGQIRTCLFSNNEHNLRDILRSGASRDEIGEFIKSVVFQKEPRHQINDRQFIQPQRTMSFIGG